MNKHWKTNLDPERLLNRNRPKEFQTQKVPTDVVEITNDTNKGGYFLFVNKP